MKELKMMSFSCVTYRNTDTVDSFMTECSVTCYPVTAHQMKKKRVLLLDLVFFPPVSHGLTHAHARGI